MAAEHNSAPSRNLGVIGNIRNSVVAPRQMTEVERQMMQEMARSLVGAATDNNAPLPTHWSQALSRSVMGPLAAMHLIGRGADAQNLAADDAANNPTVGGTPNANGASSSVVTPNPVNLASLGGAGVSDVSPNAGNAGPTGVANVSAGNRGGNSRSSAFREALIQIESSGNPHNRTGSYRGLGQFGRDQEQRFGITEQNWTDPNVQRTALNQHLNELSGQFRRAHNREAEPHELYLMHQQGQAGGPALINADPSTPAWRAIRRFYGSDRMAQLAISGNIPRDSPLARRSVTEVTAGDFVNLWNGRFGRALAAVQGNGNNSTVVPTANNLGAGAVATAIPAMFAGTGLENAPSGSTGVGLPPEWQQHRSNLGGPGLTNPGSPEPTGEAAVIEAQHTGATPPVAPAVPNGQQQGAGANNDAWPYQNGAVVAAPEPRIGYLQHIIRSPNQPAEFRIQAANELASLLSPRSIDVGMGTVIYDPRTGAQIAFQPKVASTTESIGDYSGTARSIIGPGGNLIRLGPVSPNERNFAMGSGANATGGGANADAPHDASVVGQHFTPLGRGRAVIDSGNLDDIRQWQRDQQALNEVSQAGTRQHTELMSQANVAPRVIQTLETMLAASRRGGFVRGNQLATDQIHNVRTFLSNFMQMGEGVQNRELVNHLNTYLAQLTGQAMGASGTNFSLQTIMANNPNVAMSVNGFESLISLAIQEQRHTIEINNRANAIRRTGGTPDVAQIREQYYREHPLTLNLRDRANNPVNVTLRPVTNAQERDALPSGTYYLDPNGAIRRRP